MARPSKYASRAPEIDMRAKGARARAARRRLVEPGTDPATCDPDYTPEQVEFLRACDLIRERLHKRFLTATDYLEVAVQLGYRKP
jgi:hypothetical protein